jgi:glycosyltransferase involved in cell wall biosynthesis
MKISYLITTHNEDSSLEKLLSKLTMFIKKNQEIVILDDFSDNKHTLEIFEKYKNNIFLNKRKLDRHYGEHKNHGIDLCNGDYIFQIDGDEYPTDLLLENIDLIIEQNKDSEVMWVPRINKFHGVTNKHASQWGWNLKYKGYVNFPDYQSRIFMNVPHIRYQRRLHEKVEGYKSHSFIPPQEEYAIVHEKSIEKQILTNVEYNKKFTMEENKGYSVK